jgi:hypothetical protein
MYHQRSRRGCLTAWVWENDCQGGLMDGRQGLGGDPLGIEILLLPFSDISDGGSELAIGVLLKPLKVLLKPLKFLLLLLKDARRLGFSLPSLFRSPAFFLISLCLPLCASLCVYFLNFQSRKAAKFATGKLSAVLLIGFARTDFICFCIMICSVSTFIDFHDDRSFLLFGKNCVFQYVRQQRDD